MHPATSNAVWSMLGWTAGAVGELEREREDSRSLHEGRSVTLSPKGWEGRVVGSNTQIQDAQLDLNFRSTMNNFLI